MESKLMSMRNTSGYPLCPFHNTILSSINWSDISIYLLSFLSYNILNGFKHSNLAIASTIMKSAIILQAEQHLDCSACKILALKDM